MMSAQLQGFAASRNTVSAAAAERGPAPASSRSPYVDAQKASPIRWETFGQRAVDRARTENKLIFLHIGYSASHYCYLTIQESFSNPHVIELLNQHFVPIIVDREERPDLDTIYMNYVQSLNSAAAGHPLNVLLTPALEPVFGGTYFPSPGSHQIVPETGDEIADFLVVLQKAQTSWAEQEAQIRADGRQSVEMLRKMIDEGTLGLGDTTGTSAAEPSGQQPSDVDIDQLEEAYSHISKTFDKSHGGFLHMPAYVPPNFLSGQIPPDQMGEVYELIKMMPKFILPAKISFLLRATQFPQTVVDVVGDKLSSDCTQFAIQTLRQVIASAVHDHVGAGFHRCSTTWDWSLPSFEKMLSDNALALGIYLDAWLLNGASKDGEFAGVVLELADYLTQSPIRLEHGGFASSEAADSCNKRGDKVLRHGAYYLWTRKEFDTVIGDEQQSRVAAAYWNVKEHGNVDNAQDPNDEYLNQNILRVVKSPAELSAQFTLPEASIRKLIESAQAKLKARREKDRPRPALDAKLVTAYNGMAIAALARTYSACEAAGKIDKAAGYLSAAKDAALFIKKQLWDAETKILYRLYYNGARSGTKAFAEDYAFLIEGILELYEATSDDSWLEWAIELQGKSSPCLLLTKAILLTLLQRPKSRSFTTLPMTRRLEAMLGAEPFTAQAKTSLTFCCGLRTPWIRHSLRTMQCLLQTCSALVAC
jgi:uncharacterized protein YyaL (SSP411 family)